MDDESAGLIRGLIVLLGIFVLSLYSAILIYRRRKSAALGVLGGVVIGVVAWLCATMLFWYFSE